MTGSATLMYMGELGSNRLKITTVLDQHPSSHNRRNKKQEKKEKIVRRSSIENIIIYEINKGEKGLIDR